ncbi:MAG: F0F1 ATP synthase subunit A [Ignavibacteriae bacterium]|nr:F0F1 ATP synthase subunit A [Ignavibacteriota bacterium]
MLLQTHTSIADTTQAVADTAQAAGHGEKFNFAHLLDHMKDSRELEFPGGHGELPIHLPTVEIAGITFDFNITKHVFFLLLSAFVLIIFAVAAARQNKKNLVPRGLGNLMEVFIVFMRDEVVLPNMGKAGLRYMPYVLTTFFFILIMNLAGLIPYGASATSNVSVTAGLAIVAFIMIQLAAIRAQGLKHYLAHLTGGVHPVLWPIMIPIEVLGLFTKPFALCIRLFANMTGGHIVILSLIGLIFLFRSWAIAPVPVVFVLGINMLELFVAFLQAYVFTMLTSLFMGLGIQAAHSEEHAEHAEGHH